MTIVYNILACVWPRFWTHLISGYCQPTQPLHKFPCKRVVVQMKELSQRNKGNEMKTKGFLFCFCYEYLDFFLTWASTWHSRAKKSRTVLMITATSILEARVVNPCKGLRGFKSCREWGNPYHVHASVLPVHPTMHQSLASQISCNFPEKFCMGAECSAQIWVQTSL